MDEDKLAWLMIYANIVGFQYHPGNPAKGRMSHADAATLADDAVLQLHRRFPHGSDS